MYYSRFIFKISSLKGGEIWGRARGRLKRLPETLTTLDTTNPDN